MSYHDLMQKISAAENFNAVQPILLTELEYGSESETSVTLVMTNAENFLPGEGKYWSLILCEIMVKYDMTIAEAKSFCKEAFGHNIWKASHKGFVSAFFNARDIIIELNNGTIYHKTSIFAFSLSINTLSSAGEIIESYHPSPILDMDGDAADNICEQLNTSLKNQVLPINKENRKDLKAVLLSVGLEEQAGQLKLMKKAKSVSLTILKDDEAPNSTVEAYLKLSLLSHRLVLPHGVNYEGIFGLLPNNAWTNLGAIAIDDLQDRQTKARAKGEIIHVHSVDKFPPMCDHIVPTGIRIGDASRVRFGAYVGEGTTVMHEGFINFDAGTLGVSMVEGRISKGVIVGHGSDVGGGASTMGTLSGGNDIVISVGDNCLLGANSGLGLPLGDRCTVEAGLYATAGSKVTMLDDQNNEVSTVKAAELAGKSDLLFRRNSQSGRIEVKTNKSAIELNEELHKHN